MMTFTTLAAIAMVSSSLMSLASSQLIPTAPGPVSVSSLPPVVTSAPARTVVFTRLHNITSAPGPFLSTLTALDTITSAVAPGYVAVMTRPRVITLAPPSTLVFSRVKTSVVSFNYTVPTRWSSVVTADSTGVALVHTPVRIPVFEPVPSDVSASSVASESSRIFSAFIPHVMTFTPFADDAAVPSSTSRTPSMRKPTIVDQQRVYSLTTSYRPASSTAMPTTRVNQNERRFDLFGPWGTPGPDVELTPIRTSTLATSTTLVPALTLYSVKPSSLSSASSAMASIQPRRVDHRFDFLKESLAKTATATQVSSFRTTVATSSSSSSSSSSSASSVPVSSSSVLPAPGSSSRIETWDQAGYLYIKDASGFKIYHPISALTGLNLTNTTSTLKKHPGNNPHPINRHGFNHSAITNELIPTDPDPNGWIVSVDAEGFRYIRDADGSWGLVDKNNRAVLTVSHEEFDALVKQLWDPKPEDEIRHMLPVPALASNETAEITARRMPHRVSLTTNGTLDIRPPPHHHNTSSTSSFFSRMLRRFTSQHASPSNPSNGTIALNRTATEGPQNFTAFVDAEVNATTKIHKPRNSGWLLTVPLLTGAYSAGNSSSGERSGSHAETEAWVVLIIIGFATVTMVTVVTFCILKSLYMRRERRRRAANANANANAEVGVGVELRQVHDEERALRRQRGNSRKWFGGKDETGLKGQQPAGGDPWYTSTPEGQESGVTAVDPDWCADERTKARIAALRGELKC